MKKFCLVFAAVVVGGCVHVPSGALGVPPVLQQTDYSCGPAALMAVLQYWQRDVRREQDLYGPLHTTPKDGTEPGALAEVARAHGLWAEYRAGATLDDLRAALAAGQTVILDLQAWRETLRRWRDDWDDGHYVVLLAIDRGRLYVMDPSADHGYSWLDVEEFLARWHDYELHDGQRRNLQHMAVFIAGSAHGFVTPGRLEKMR